ncbi:MAG: ABC transporter ATP-binding protein [Actinomycetales bacterium]
MSSITFDQATCVYPGSDVPALDHLDLEVADGELLVLVGPARSGKTSALRLIAGLEDVAAGRVLIGGRDVTNVPPKDRDVAMVFQNYALYPHLSVADNMGFTLKISGVPADEVTSRVTQAAEILGLTGYLSERPAALSSAQRQQVALGRAVVREPRVFLMDEPLVALEPSIREQTRDQIARLQKHLGVTTVYATTDPLEAMLMADRVAVLIDGRLQQVGPPREVYDSPVNAAVAGFIGLPPMNLFPLGVESGQVRLGDLLLPVPQDDLTEVQVGVRPEDLTVTTLAADPAPQTLVGTVQEVYDTDGDGSYARVAVECLPEPLLGRVSGDRVEVGTRVNAFPDPRHVHLFSLASGRRL